MRSLLAAYDDPSRGHHSVRHLREVLARLDELAAAGAGFGTVPVQAGRVVPRRDLRRRAGRRGAIRLVGRGGARAARRRRHPRRGGPPGAAHRAPPPRDPRRQRVRAQRRGPVDPGGAARALRGVRRRGAQGVRPPARRGLRRRPGRRAEPGLAAKPQALPHRARHRGLGGGGAQQHRRRVWRSLLPQA
ncbi:hypothetical protein G5V59_22295 [Nocardioides sp. W3-2-3]|uniref:hypothetical protein n=1 Tax=Nocardioides convexus TaxID=2712224 RepID=UPI00241873BE|nr:hypothetical protein [Nocardioides convexus]NHA01586.1 hypothetical protein [Nocardioides convexus]